MRLGSNSVCQGSNFVCLRSDPECPRSNSVWPGNGSVCSGGKCVLRGQFCVSGKHFCARGEHFCTRPYRCLHGANLHAATRRRPQNPCLAAPLQSHGQTQHKANTSRAHGNRNHINRHTSDPKSLSEPPLGPRVLTPNMTIRTLAANPI